MDVVVDHTNNKLIWTDLANHKIVRGNLDGSGSPEDLVTGTSFPHGLIIDEAAGYIY
ncbi:MAG: hypothetical protein K1X79_03560 [Oligoflexia bacterium]|nr:hypothetical protein [Oligoflexia bacterium]